MGQFGIVYEIADSKGRRLALKTLVTAGLDASETKALVNEGRLATEIDHPNAIHVHYFHDGHEYPEFPPYMILEFADGGTLQGILDERRASGNLIANGELRAMFSQLVAGMDAVNRKLVHRDIKPDNILVVDGVLKIADFGLAKMVGVATRTSTFKGVNHVKYCAPEAWMQATNTPTMDMYSMGLVFYELATLHHPYQVSASGDVVGAWRTAHLTQPCPSPSERNSTLDLALAQVILKMVDKRPERRFKSWGDAAARLEEPDNSPHDKPDVSELVKKAVDHDQRQEKERLQLEELRRERTEREQRIVYAFREVRLAAEEITEHFNQSSDFARLVVQEHSDTSFSIRSDRNVAGMVSISVTPATDDYFLDRKRILAWGHARTDSGRGFSLLLVQQSSDDLYGQWRTLHVTHSPLVVRQDPRPEPFPFEIDELPNELELLNAVHIYQTEKGVFQRDMLMPLMAELV